MDPDFGDRAWAAYMALPRDERGRPPPKTKIEQGDIEPPAPGLVARGLLEKIFSGQRKGVNSATLPKLAKVLGTTPEFLSSGAGEWPQPSGPFIPRPRRFGSDGKPIPMPPAVVFVNDQASHTYNAANLALRVDGGPGLRAQRGSLGKARDKLLEKYARPNVYEVVATSEYLDAAQRPETIDLYIELEARLLELERLSSGGTAPVGGPGDGLHLEHPDGGAPVPSNREIQADFEGSERRFDPPKPDNSGQAKARRR